MPQWTEAEQEKIARDIWISYGAIQNDPNTGLYWLMAAQWLARHIGGS